MSDERDDLAPETWMAEPHGGPFGAVMPPIYQSSLFTFDSYADFEARMAGQSNRPLYTRVQNPTVQAFEAMMARLEHGEAAVGFASGMAAISSALLALVPPGGTIACVEHVYPDAYRLMERMLKPMGITVRYHPVKDFETDPDLMAGATLAYLESPTSMMFQVADLRRIAENARRHGCLTLVDNSWASPVFQQPLTLGIDAVVHSASKYISGHSDTVAGVVVSSADIVGRLRDLTLPLLGGKLAPFEAWLLVRGLRTLDARMRAHERTANIFIDRLAGCPDVTAIHSPGANSAPGLQGRSGLMSIELAESIDIPAFADALNLFRLGVSWGGFESLVVPAGITLKQAGEANSARAFGVPERLVRLSLGLENADDLWRDVENALNAARR